MPKQASTNMVLTRFLDEYELRELKHAVEETWQELQADRDWVCRARRLK